MSALNTDLLRIFAAEAKDDLAEMVRLAGETEDRAARARLGDLAHNIKGGADMVALGGLAQGAARLIETLGGKIDREGLLTRIDELSRIIDAALEGDLDTLQRLDAAQKEAPRPGVNLPKDLSLALRDLFLSEAHEHLSGMRDTLSEVLDSKAASESAGARSRLFRHLLNLQSASAMAAQRELAELCSLLIVLLEGAEIGAYALARADCAELFAQGVELGFSWLDAIHLDQDPEGAAALAAFRAELMKLRPDIAHQIEAPRREPSVVVAFDEDDEELMARELRDIFRAEGAEHLATLSRLIMQAEKEGHSPELVQALFRTVHTLKGAAGTVGYTALAEAAHHLETQIDAWLKEGRPLDETLLGVLYMGERTLRALLDQGEEPIGEQAEAEATLAETLPVLGLSDPSRLPGAGVAPPSGDPGRTLRVPMQRLDHMMNLVSALHAHRARVEDMGAAFLALAKKLKWERKTRGKMVDDFTKRHQYERPGGAPESGPRLGVFSELEFDRYSEMAVFARSLEESEFRLNGLIKRVEAELGRFAEEGASFATLVGSMRDEMAALRLVPIESLFERTTFQALNLARSLGKKVRVEREGVGTEVDKALVDGLADALMHLVRNALDHGIESPELRRARGKPEAGTIRLSATSQARHVEIRIEDDGSGIDTAKVVQAAIKANVLSAAAAESLSGADLAALIFHPGVSSRTKADQISGRGVGLDVVRHQVAALYGSVRVESQPGTGTSFILTLPLAVAIQPLLCVGVDEFKLNLPMAYVEEILEPGYERPTPTTLAYKSETLPLRRLSGYLRIGRDGTSDHMPAVVLHMAERRLALAVDAVYEREEAIVQPLPGLLDSLAPYHGTTITPDGDVRLVLNVPGLFEADDRLPALVHAQAPQAEAVRVLIADDSLSVRQTLKKLLERHGIKAATARDGLYAWQKLHSATPDLMIVDLEMPGLNGYELMQRVRQHPEFVDLPMLVLTSRVGQKHMDMAYESGADAFLSKPVLERELIATIRDVLPRERRELLDLRDPSAT